MKLLTLILCVGLSSLHATADYNYSPTNAVIQYFKNPVNNRPDTVRDPAVWLKSVGWSNDLKQKKINAITYRAIKDLQTGLKEQIGVHTVYLDKNKRTQYLSNWSSANTNFYSLAITELELAAQTYKTNDTKVPLKNSFNIRYVNKMPKGFICTWSYVKDGGFDPYLLTIVGNQYTSSLSGQELMAFKTVGERMKHLMVAYNKGLKETDIEQATARRQAWENRLFNGYSQMPWELLLNKYLPAPGKKGLDAPPWQYVIVHPELAAGVPTSGVPSSEKTPNWELDFHLGGLIIYPTQSRNWYLGASGTLAYNNDFGEGWGPTLHTGGWNKSIPNISLGYRWFDDDVQAVVIGVDLFNYLGGQKGVEDKIGWLTK